MLCKGTANSYTTHGGITRGAEVHTAYALPASPPVPIDVQYMESVSPQVPVRGAVLPWLGAVLGGSLSQGTPGGMHGRQGHYKEGCTQKSCQGACTQQNSAGLSATCCLSLPPASAAAASP